MNELQKSEEAARIRISSGFDACGIIFPRKASILKDA